jgi:hypothetical protein
MQLLTAFAGTKDAKRIKPFCLRLAGHGPGHGFAVGRDLHFAQASQQPQLFEDEHGGGILSGGRQWEQASAADRSLFLSENTRRTADTLQRLLGKRRDARLVAWSGV